MPETKPRTKAAKSAKSATATKKRYEGFTAEERAAMQDRVREMRVVARRGADDAQAESDMLAKIAELKEPDRAMAKRLHTIIKASAPVLTPRLWYGMPAYYKNGKLVCHFQPAQKFKTRYPTLGFSDAANLDDGSMWPNAYALMKLTASEEAKIAALVKRAVS